HKENLIDSIYETEKKKSLISATPMSTAFFSTSFVQDFQARSLLAKSKRLCGSSDHDTNDHNKIISLKREIKPRNLQHVIKRCETCGSTVHNIIDHYDIKWFKGGEALQAKHADALKSKKTRGWVSRQN
ncbi:hypothetical protein Tco_0196850, partial [Tanacetum coccineum]